MADGYSVILEQPGLPAIHHVKPRLGRFQAALIGLLIGVIGFGFMLSLPRYDTLFDFASFMASGRAAARGANAYGDYSADLIETFGAHIVRHPNLNPPIFVLAMQPFIGLTPLAGFIIWYVGSLALYMVVLVLLVREYPAHATPLRLAWCLGLTGLWETLRLGQVYMPLLLLCALVWILLRQGRFVPAGVLLGVAVALKPNLALWIVALFVTGCHTTALAAAGSVLAVSAVPLAVYGPGMYADWLTLIGSSSKANVALNSSVFALLQRMGLPWLALLVAAILVVIVMGVIWRGRVSPSSAGAFAIVLTLVVSPVTWPGYTLLLLPVFFSRLWGRALVVSSVLLVLPAHMMRVLSDSSDLLFWTAGSAYRYALLLLLGVLLYEQWKEGRSRVLLSVHAAEGSSARQ